jgi:hypothetical protein
MGFRPRTLREALLYELCVRQGFCSAGLTPEDLTESLTAREIAEMVLVGESLDPPLNEKMRNSVERQVSDWLFDPQGRGARSGLPR